MVATAPPLPSRPGADATRGEIVHWAWVRARHGWPAAYPLAQFPNAALIGALLASLLAGLLAGGAQAAAQATSAVLLACWAWLELTGGVNLWRRLLGLSMLVATILRLAERF